MIPEIVQNVRTVVLKSTLGDWSIASHDLADVNECEEAEPCEDEAHSICTNSQGSYSCDCEQGYKKEGKACVVDVEG